MGSDDGTSELVELRPAPSVLLRHRDAELDVVAVDRSGPRIELRRGALWIRAGEDGPGVTVTHGAASVQVRAGAGLLEVHDLEALLVVASGRAAVKGVSPLPRSVMAGQAVTLTLDGTFTDPDALSAAELAADRMVVENLALDNLGSSTAPAPAPASAAPPEPDPVPDVAPEEPDPTEAHDGSAVPDTTGEAARVDPPLAPRRPEPPAPLPTRPGRRSAPAAAVAEPSALETALANVGVGDQESEGSPAEAPGATPATDPATPATPAVEARRVRLIILLVIGALLVLALVAALAFGADAATA
ncbi:hypothetical protein HC251_11725 [Iamia sp. SCSIO 61187]|uniref:hypothetical protein n=1 Tax=Iamia sp. SCSIO 61187 TaxID=2722752 RepID=UPI001C6338D8|nr:hypothetical protein [Iamia sp. SCSIO 61187]QYG93036.1 hypothetical protein HC251_11725 [Iamia sp. SCSIO 61187]